MSTVYAASPVKRRRATRDEMEERAEFFIAYAMAHAPVTVRGLYYQAEVAGLPGIDKDELGYCKVQRQVLDLRRQGRLPYGCIADGTRWAVRARTFDSVEDALPADELRRLKAIEAAERESFTAFARTWRAA